VFCLKAICSVALLVITTIVIAQDSIRITEPLPINSEKINLIYPKIYWFNKYEITLENYGVARVKEGITSTSAKNKKGITYSETKQKITINLTDFDHHSSTLQARTVQNDEYTIKENVLENTLLKELGTGIETEEIHNMIIFPKSIKGNISTNSENDKVWNIDLKLAPNSIQFIEVGKLTSGDRTINVIQTNVTINQYLTNDNTRSTLNYQFIENGIVLGAVTFNEQNVILLKPGVDPTTKLVLCTTLLILLLN
jgi:hypothetical protein